MKEKPIERALPLLSAATLGHWLDNARTVNGIVKGLKKPDWPVDPWDPLHRLAMQVARACALQ